MGQKEEKEKMRIEKMLNVVYAFTLIFLILLSGSTPITSSVVSTEKQPKITHDATTMSLPPGQKNMTFTSDVTMNLTSGTYVTFTSGVTMSFTSGIMIIFSDIFNSGLIQPCFVGQILQGPLPEYCNWWEILDQMGNPTGYEFHVDTNDPPYLFHTDKVVDAQGQATVYPILPGSTVIAEKKIDELFPCLSVVVQPPASVPTFCTWWEIIYPIQWQGIEFHADGSSGSEFHIDSMTAPTPPLPIPPYEVVAELKIATIKPCDSFVVKDPATVPDPCSWWEILTPKEFMGYEFHVDSQTVEGQFHVDSVVPGNVTFSTPTPEVTAEKKISSIKPCTWLEIESSTGDVPQVGDWWEITYPPQIAGYEFLIDSANSTYVHVSQVQPSIISGVAVYKIIAERKIQTISSCDWFKIVTPASWHPDICSWWSIVSPSAWLGAKFHVDSYVAVGSIFKFHIDYVGGPLAPLTPPPWNVTAEPIDPPLYWKKYFIDYAPSGMPDFDERQGLTYNWSSGGVWSHCVPTAIANSLWWLDSEFEPGGLPPPIISDGFPLVRSYNSSNWDDHDPLNAPPLIEHLAYLMDTDGQRTLIPLTAHVGTNIKDSEDGLAQYLSWTRLNPIGDVNGDGVVNATDYAIVVVANNTVPGAPKWDMAADIYPVTLGWPNITKTDNIVNQTDINLVVAHMGNSSGSFYERTIAAPDFPFIDSEVEKCEDVVLAVGFWSLNAGIWERYNYTVPYPNTGRNGHAVTVAGVNLTTSKIAICDPAFDAYENNLITEGRIPISHNHAPPEPPYITHNRAGLVSQDIYSVIQLPPVPPCPGGNWAIAGYAGLPANIFTVIEYAVVTSPIRDVEVTNVTNSKADCTVGPPNVGTNKTTIPLPTVLPTAKSLRVNVTVANRGNFAEAFNVTIYANGTVVNQTLVSLASLSQATVTIPWNTSGFNLGNYKISASADIGPADANTSNNNMADGIVLVTLVGDVDGNRMTRVADILYTTNRFGTDRGGPPNSQGWYYDSNCDINDDDKIRVADILFAVNNFGQGPW